MTDQFKQAFKDEAYEHLAELESSLMEMEESPEESGLIGRVFRTMHTIKGSGAMFGFDTIARFTHEVETVFDLVRNGRLPVTGELVNLSLRARDRIRIMLDADDRDPDRAASDELIAAFKRLAGRSTTENVLPVSHGVAPSSGEENAAEVTYHIRFKPHGNIFRSGLNPGTLLYELRELGKSTMVLHMSDVPPLGVLDPEHCYLFWDVTLTTHHGINAIRDVFIFVEDDCDLTIDIDDGIGLDRDDGFGKPGEIMTEQGCLVPEARQDPPPDSTYSGTLAVASGVADREPPGPAGTDHQQGPMLRRKHKPEESGASIRVPAERLDVLLNLVGELVTIQARFSQTAQQRDDEEFLAIAEEVERLTVELRDNTLNIRMLPIGSTFSKLKRLVRDLSGELGKQIEMTTEGAETELDKTVIEKLSDPLVHLIRNSIDHGIEGPDIREQQGKPRRGIIHLSAAHSGDSVLITIRDDGAGLDREAIRSKAIEKGLISPAAELSDQEIFNQIFAPGFSTAKQVTSVSGRGVGMDVVKKAIEALRGRIAISSVRGSGTTITVKIPLTLAIIESLLVQVGTDCFVMPLALVDECTGLTRRDISNARGRNLARVRDTIIPYIPLRERFGIDGPLPELQQIVIMTVEERHVGFVVDQVIGEHQTVIKSLGKYYMNVQGVSGATILGDGNVALILDIPALIQNAELDAHMNMQK